MKSVIRGEMMRKLFYFILLMTVFVLALSLPMKANADDADYDVCRIIRLIIEPVEAVKGQPVTVTAVIEKTGDNEVICRATLSIDKAVVGTEDIFYAATIVEPCGDTCSGGTQLATFNVTKDIPGIYLVDVNGLTGSFIVKDNFAPANASQILDDAVPELTPAVKSEQGVKDIPAQGSGNRLIIAVILVVVLFVALVGYSLIKNG